MWLIFKTEILINQSKAKLDEKILFGKITHLQDPKVIKCLYGVCMVIENYMFHSGPFFIWQ